MLASRPTAVQKPPQRKTTSKPFVSGGNTSGFVSKAKQVVGMSVAAENRRKFLIARGPSAEEKHKTWLAELKALKENAMVEAEIYMEAKAEEKQKFIERSSALRKLLRQGKWKESHVHCSNTKKNAIKGHLTATTKKLNEMALTAEQKEVEEAAKVTEEEKSKAKICNSSKVSTKKLAKRPGWALTEDQHREVEEAEDEDLLNFATNLDFDQYLEDIEVKDALSFVHKRVTEIEDAKKVIVEEEAKRAQAVEDLAKNEETAKKAIERAERIDAAEAAEVEIKTGATEGTPHVQQTATQVVAPSSPSEMSKKDFAARLILSEKKIKKIHSKNSVKAILNDRREAIKNRSGSEVVQRYNKEKEVPDENTTTKKKRLLKPNLKPTHDDTKKIQNLPYLYRHPAI